MEQPLSPIKSGNSFGIEGLEYYEFLEDQEITKSGKKKKKEVNDSNIDVFFSPDLHTHMRKVLGKDKEAVKVERVNKSGDNYSLSADVFL